MLSLVLTDLKKRDHTHRDILATFWQCNPLNARQFVQNVRRHLLLVGTIPQTQDLTGQRLQLAFFVWVLLRQYKKGEDKDGWNPSREDVCNCKSLEHPIADASLPALSHSRTLCHIMLVISGQESGLISTSVRHWGHSFVFFPLKAS